MLIAWKPAGSSHRRRNPRTPPKIRRCRMRMHCANGPRRLIRRHTRSGICGRPTTSSTTAICGTSCPSSTASSASPACGWRDFSMPRSAQPVPLGEEKASAAGHRGPARDAMSASVAILAPCVERHLAAVLQRELLRFEARHLQEGRERRTIRFARHPAQLGDELVDVLCELACGPDLHPGVDVLDIGAGDYELFLHTHRDLPSFGGWRLRATPRDGVTIATPGRDVCELLHTCGKICRCVRGMAGARPCRPKSG